VGADETEIEKGSGSDGSVRFDLPVEMFTTGIGTDDDDADAA
jgi:hypothetical protein